MLLPSAGPRSPGLLHPDFVRHRLARLSLLLFIFSSPLLSASSCFTLLLGQWQLLLAAVGGPACARLSNGPQRCAWPDITLQGRGILSVR